MALKKYSLRLRGHATSVRLEPEFWEALSHAASEASLSPPSLIEQIDDARDAETSLASAIRLYVLKAQSEHLKPSMTDSKSQS